MTTDQARRIFYEIKAHYDLIPSPKFRHADLDNLKEKFEQLQGLKDDLGHDRAYSTLINGISQVIAKLERHSKLASLPKDRIWSNLSERGKVLKRRRFFFVVLLTSKKRIYFLCSGNTESSTKMTRNAF